MIFQGDERRKNVALLMLKRSTSCQRSGTKLSQSDWADMIGPTATASNCDGPAERAARTFTMSQ